MDYPSRSRPGECCSRRLGKSLGLSPRAPVARALSSVSGRATPAISTFILASLYMSSPTRSRRRSMKRSRREYTRRSNAFRRMRHVWACSELSASPSPSGPAEFVEILNATGERIRYPVSRLVDVYHPATEMKERIPAADLRPGMLMIVLVDDYYEDVFERLLEAIREERDLKASMALDLWQCAKQAALSKHAGKRRRLFEALVSAGLRVKYEAVV